MDKVVKRRGWLLRQVFLASLLPGLCCLMAACTTNSANSDGSYSTSQPGDDFLRDPTGATIPRMQDPNISGGAINNYDSKAMKKDLDDVLNP
jgi:hypothetical protein